MSLKFFPRFLDSYFLKKGIAPIIIAIIVAIIAVGGAGGYMLINKSKIKNQNLNTQNQNTDNPNNQVVCAQDVNECPDGSFVSRVPPKCEFAICPAVTSAVDTTG